MALRLIPGTDFSVLLSLIADPSTAKLLSAVLVFSLAYMVMIGCWLRGAALVLGLLTFFAAFVAYVGPMGSGELGAFWRDIALVAALMLTYSRELKGREAPRPAPPVPTDTTKVADLAAHRARVSASRPMDLRAPLGPDEIENIFLDYA